MNTTVQLCILFLMSRSSNYMWDMNKILVKSEKAREDSEKEIFILNLMRTPNCKYGKYETLSFKDIVRTTNTCYVFRK